MHESRAYTYTHIYIYARVYLHTMREGRRKGVVGRRCWVNLIVGFWVSASRRHWVLARRELLAARGGVGWEKLVEWPGWGGGGGCRFEGGCHDKTRSVPTRRQRPSSPRYAASVIRGKCHPSASPLSLTLPSPSYCYRFSSSSSSFFFLPLRSYLSPSPFNFHLERFHSSLSHFSLSLSR